MGTHGMSGTSVPVQGGTNRQRGGNGTSLSIGLPGYRLEGKGPEMAETIITQRLLNEATKQLRRDLKLFAAAEVNALRPRLDRLEAAHHMGELHTHLDSWAEDMAHRLDPEADE